MYFAANIRLLMELYRSKGNDVLRDFTTLLTFLVSKLWEPGRQPGGWNTEHAVLCYKVQSCTAVHFKAERFALAAVNFLQETVPALAVYCHF